MKAKLIRSFAAGLLLATAVSGSVYFLSSSDSLNDSSTDGNKEKLSTEEMKTLLTEEGYKVLTEVELAEQLAAAQIEAEESQEQQEATEDIVEENSVHSAVVTVASGMTATDVGDALVNAQIIESRQAFVDAVEQKGLVQELRPGSYTVQSDMTLDQVIATIYRQ